MFTGVVCSMLLFQNSKKQSNKYLGLGILGFVFVNTKILLHSLNLWQIHGFGFFPNGIELAIPPLFYFYVKSLIRPTFRLKGKQWLHFVPFFLLQIYFILVYIAIMRTTILSEKRVIAEVFYFNEVKNIEDYLTVLSAFIYLFIGYRKIQEYRNWLSKNITDTKYSELSFLNISFYGILFITIYVLINLILTPILDNYHSWRWQISHVLIAALVYYLGIIGYKNSDLIPIMFSEKSRSNPKPEMAKELVDDVINKLEKSFHENKVHLNPKLTLKDLAKLLGVSETNLSYSINIFYKENFRSVINKKRIEEVKERLLNDESVNLSFLGLAKECGFNSEASFYRIFKKVVGITPKQFLEKNKISIGK